MYCLLYSMFKQKWTKTILSFNFWKEAGHSWQNNNSCVSPENDPQFPKFMKLTRLSVYLNICAPFDSGIFCLKKLRLRSLFEPTITNVPTGMNLYDSDSYRCSIHMLRCFCTNFRFHGDILIESSSIAILQYHLFVWKLYRPL